MGTDGGSYQKIVSDFWKVPKNQEKNDEKYRTDFITLWVNWINQKVKMVCLK